MNRKINAIETKESNEKAELKEHDEVENPTLGSKDERSKSKKKETEVTVDENKGRVKDTKKGDEKFKCEECSYETKKKITLKKHINTKHGNTKESTEKGGNAGPRSDEKDDKTNENVCETCKSCEDCDFIKNGDKCDKCKVWMFKWAAEQCGEVWSVDSD